MRVLLPEPEAPVMATSCPSGIATSTPLRLFSRAPAHGEASGRCPGGAGRAGRWPAAPTGTARWARPGRPARRPGVPCTTTWPAVHARAGPHLHQVVGGADGVLVVLDDDDRVADVAQALERGDHLDVVLGVKADARLVEHVQHPHQARADLGRQADPLRLAPRQGARAAAEVQVVEPDAQQQLQPPADLAQHLPAGVGPPAAAARARPGRRAARRSGAGPAPGCSCRPP